MTGAGLVQLADVAGTDVLWPASLVCCRGHDKTRGRRQSGRDLVEPAFTQQAARLLHRPPAREV